MKPISLKHRLRYSFLLLASLTLLPTTESQAQERKEEIRLEVTQNRCLKCSASWKRAPTTNSCSVMTT